MRAKKLFAPTADMTNSKIYVASLIKLSAHARAHHAIVCGVEVIWTDAIPTAATDGIHIYINPEFFLWLPNHSQRATLLFHECDHIMKRHPMRGKFYHDRGFFAVASGEKIPYIHSLFNQGCDYHVNADAEAHGLEPIASGYLDTSRFTRDDVVDTIYAQLIKEYRPEPDGDDGDGGGDDDDGDDGSRTEPNGGDTGEGDQEGDQDGDGGGSQGDDAGDDDSGGDSGEESGDGNNKLTSQEPSNHGGHDDHFFPEYEEGEDGEEAAAQDAHEMGKLVERSIKDAAKDPESKNIGSSGDLGHASTYGGGNSETNVPWTEIFANRFTRAGSGGRLNWGRIHRRRYSTLGIVSPTRRGTFNQVAVTIDISGSVDHSVCHDKVFPELGVMIDHLKPTSGCIILLTDTKVQHVVTVHSGAELLDVQIPYGGGTYMHSGAVWLEENGHMPDVHICFTDGHMNYSDYENCANSDMFLVIDNELNYNYNLSNIRQSQIEAICADDNWVAA